MATAWVTSREDIEKWNLVGGHHAYHFLGSAIWFNRIGHIMGESMHGRAPPDKDPSTLGVAPQQKKKP